MMSAKGTVNHYEIMGVAPSASPTEIKSRYRFLMYAFHSDRFNVETGHVDLAREETKRINDSYAVLSNPEQRLQFDRTRRLEEGGGTSPELRRKNAQLERQLYFLRVSLEEREKDLEEARLAVTAMAEGRAAAEEHLADLLKVRQLEKALWEGVKLAAENPYHLAAAGRAGELPRVAFVDDEDHILCAAKRAFNDEPIDLRLFTNPHEALQCMEAMDFAVVISDQRMPQMSGTEFLARARQIRPQTIGLMLTGYADMATVIAAINEGHIFHFLTKPWDDSELKLVLRNTLAYHGLQGENRRLLELSLEQNKELQKVNVDLEAIVKRRTSHITVLLRRMKIGLNQVIQALLALMEFHDPLLVGHSRRVAEWSERIARHLPLDKEEAELLASAALLHDVGLMGLPKPITSETAQFLGAAEAALLRQHPQYGYTVLSHIEGFSQVAKVVRAHHENYDGTGYPDLLRGETIPLAARIVRVASDLDQLLCWRRLSVYDAFHTLALSSGKAYDPRVVRALREATQRIRGSTHELSMSVEDLRAGMVLGRDILAPDGRLLLSKGSRIHTSHLQTLHGLRHKGQVIEPIYISNMIRPESASARKDENR